MSKFKCNTCQKEMEAEEAPMCCDAPMTAVPEEQAGETQPEAPAETSESAEEPAAEVASEAPAEETPTESSEEPKTE